MARRKRRQSESESEAQDLSNKTVKRKLEEKSTATEELTDNDVTHDAIIPSPPPNVEVRRATFIVENASLRKGIVRKVRETLEAKINFFEAFLLFYLFICLEFYFPNF